VRVRLYTREDCCLCEEAADVLQKLRRKIAFDLELVYIDSVPRGEEIYGERIPVLEVDGEEVAAAPLDEPRIRRALGL
jgi:hypothetical protein